MSRDNSYSLIKQNYLGKFIFLHCTLEMIALSIILSPVLFSSYFLILNPDNCPFMLLGVCNNLFLKLFLFNKILL